MITCLHLPVYALWSSFRTTDPTSHTPILPMCVSRFYLDSALNRAQIEWNADKANILWEVIALSRTSDNGGTDCASPLFPVCPSY